MGEHRDSSAAAPAHGQQAAEYLWPVVSPASGEQFPRALLEALAAAVYVTDAEGRITFYNDAAAELWGCRPELGSAKWCGSWRLFWPDGRPMAHDECPMAVALKEGRALRGTEAIAERPDGTRVPFIPFPTPLRDATGALVGAVNMLVDITERKRAEEELRQHRQDLEDFFENSTVALHLVAGDGTILRANKAELDLLGYSREEYVGHNVAEFHADRAVIEDILARLSRGERLDKYEARLRAKDGSIRDVLISSNVRFQDDKFVNTRCFTVDVTERKRTADAERWLAAVVESSDDAIVTKDLDGVITSWNGGAERLYGYAAAEVVGKPVTVLMPADRQNEEPEILERIRRGERIDHYETVRQRKDGALIDISLTVSPVKNGKGQIVGASKIARDITERKQAEKRTRLLTAEVDHRAKNILATVQAVASSTQADSVPEFVESFTGRVQSIARAHALLTESRWKGAELKRLIEEELAAFRGDEAKDRVSLSGPPVTLPTGAAETLSMTLHELATNAAKYGALSVPAGRLSVEWSRDVSGQVVLRWTETGGPPVQPPARQGFGTRLIARTADHLGGESRLEWRASGLVYEIAIPANKLAD